MSGALSVAGSPASVAEDAATNLVYTFTRVGATSGPLTVNFSIGGTATFNTDYTQTGAASFVPPNGTVTFAAGSSTAAITVDPTADNTSEPDETVILTLAAGTGYNVIEPSSATGTIVDDDVVADVYAFGGDDSDPLIDRHRITTRSKREAPAVEGSGHVLTSFRRWPPRVCRRRALPRRQ